VALLFCLFLTQIPLVADESISPEYQSKARFLSKFPGFVEWPAETFSSPQAPFLICVFGDYSFGTALAEITGNQQVSGRRIVIRWALKQEQLRPCQIVFISRSVAKQYDKVLAAIGESNALTVGETPEFLTAGGAIAFTFKRDVLQFELNLASSQRAHLKMSSRLLDLAQRVINPSIGART
jgi:YfiR/HmsC-like